eukprot:gnl/MRDRNA2_/MRDRNA2_180602_c0_seq1.p1 gnl/MRDRNA2_/MRDRNA2_180602_c0~~gnl/MRDRNA2_/MRDRNA2_180602_c0_seq1.p1  ORF type:complete len:228 (-),score=39.09 gnl/MRDRNA2_/MRDRNA2_180602_c0_seq1:127-741(-)
MLSPWFIFGTDVGIKDLLVACDGKLPEDISSINNLTDLTKAMHSTKGRQLVGILTSFGYTKGLLEALGLPEHERIRRMVRYATLGLFSSLQRPPVPTEEVTWRSKVGLSVQDELHTAERRMQGIIHMIQVIAPALQTLLQLMTKQQFISVGSFLMRTVLLFAMYAFLKMIVSSAQFAILLVKKGSSKCADLFSWASYMAERLHG